MRGLMMDRPLLIQSLIRHAARYRADAEIVSRMTEGPLHRYTYADAEPRAKQLAKVLTRLGVGFGDRVATTPGTTIATSRPTTRSPASVPCVTRSTRGSSPTSSPISSTTPRTRCCSST